MIDRLESSSPNPQTTRRFSTKKSFHDDSENSISIKSTPQPPPSSSINRVSIRDTYDQHVTNINNNNNNSSFVFHQRSPRTDVTTRFELDRDEIMNGGRRTTSGTTVSYFDFIF